MKTNLPGTNQFAVKRRFLKPGTYKALSLVVTGAILFGAGGVFFTNYHMQAPIVIKINAQPLLVPVKTELVSPVSTKSASLKFPQAYAAETTYDATKYSENWQEFVAAAKRIAPIYDYPLKVLLAQAALESAHGTSRMATERNNFFGYNCNDGREEQDCTSFSTPEESIIEYMRLIKREPRYAAAYDARKSPTEMIVHIKEANYATDPNYISKVMATAEWREIL